MTVDDVRNVHNVTVMRLWLMKRQLFVDDLRVFILSIGKTIGNV